MSPYPPAILGLNTRGILNGLLSPLWLKVVALVYESEELTARDTLEPRDIKTSWVSLEEGHFRGREVLKVVV